MSDQARAIEKRHKMACDICLLLDTDAAKGMEFHLYDDGFTEEEDKYICNTCLSDIKELRKKCHQKADNPHHKVFEGWIPSFAKEVPGLVEAFKKQM
jgi:hypothetical protein